MNWAFAPNFYSVVLLLSALLLGFAARVVWLRREGHPSAQPFVAIIAAQIFFLITYLLELSALDFETRFFWVRVQYFSIVIIPVLWMFFVLTYTGSNCWKMPSRHALLFALPVLTLVFIWTNDSHHLYWASIRLVEGGPAPVFESTFGIWYWVQTAYSYAMSFVTVLLLLREIFRAPRLYRRQAQLLLLAWAAAVGGSVLSLLSIPALRYFDFTPLGFSLSAAIIMISLYRVELLDIVPAARGQVLESIADGVIVIDRHCRVVDFNPAAARLLQFEPSTVIGQPVARIFAAFPEIVNGCDVEWPRRQEITRAIGGDFRCIDVQISPLRDQRGQFTGRVVVLRDTTERNRAEAELRASEEKHRVLLDSLRSPIMAFDHDFNILYCNQAYGDYMRQPVESLEGENLWELFPSFYGYSSAAAYHQVLETGIPAEFEGVQRGVHYHVWAYPTPWGGLAIAEDVTAIRQAEQAERKQRLLAEALQETASLLTATLDLDEVLDLVLENLHRVINVPYQLASVMLIEDDIARVVRYRSYLPHPIDPVAIYGVRLDIHTAANLHDVYTTGRPVIIHDTEAEPGWEFVDETRPIRAMLTAPIRVEGEVSGFLNLDSAEVGAFEAVDPDVLLAFADQAAIAIRNAQLFGRSQSDNSRLWVLNQITAIGTALTEIDDLLQTLVDTAAEIIGGDGAYIALWDEARQLVNPGAAYGKLREKYRQMRAQPGENTLTDSVRRAGRPLPVEDVFDSPYLSRRIAESFPSQSLLALPLQVDERFLGSLIIGFNRSHHFTVDEIVWAEQAADLIALAIAKSQAYDEIRDHNAELDAFSYTVAHDLRAPLNLIIGHLSLAQAEDDVPPAVFDHLAEVENAVLTMDRMIRSLLLLSQLRSAEEVIEPVALSDVIEAALARFDHEITRAGITVEIADDMPLVMGCAPWLEEVVANLVSNAIKYMGRSNTDPRIAFAAEAVADGVRCSVTDNGLGIAADDQDRLFIQFSRFHEMEAMGFGLGLSIVYRIITRLGGTVGVESALGEGSTFWFVLPAVEA